MGVLFVLLLKKEESVLVTRGDAGAFLTVLLRNTTNEKIDEHRNEIKGEDRARDDGGTERKPLCGTRLALEYAQRQERGRRFSSIR